MLLYDLYFSMISPYYDRNNVTRMIIKYTIANESILGDMFKYLNNSADSKDYQV